MKQKKGLLAAAIGLAGVLIAVAVVSIVSLNHHTDNTTAVRITLPPECTYSDLCDSLREGGVVEKRFLFNILSSTRGLQKRVHAGSYVVQPQTTLFHLVQKLRRGQQDPLKIVIGKFRTPAQLNAYLNNRLMHNDFDFAEETFHTVCPNTYEVYWTVSPKAFKERMEKEYEHFWEQEIETKGGERMSRRDLATKIAEQYSLPGSADSIRDTTAAADETLRQMVIIASIVDEETNNRAEKNLIASVYLNRLRKGMALQADPTVKYAVGDFSLRRILHKHLQTESPYNTYLHRGLPPSPICTPSAASVDAVLQAAQTKYLFFCASPQMDGTHLFAATLAEHSRNAKMYHKTINKMKIR